MNPPGGAAKKRAREAHPGRSRSPCWKTPTPGKCGAGIDTEA
jgi:hypothetical protein